MNKYQRQLSVALPTTVLTFTTMYLTFPHMWIGGVLFIPFLFSLGWTLGILFVMVALSRFGNWLGGK